ncbi:sensor histidine kinase [Aquimarina sp. 2201CG5-10]|uniref:sensor histidine kinase n=1 Tax=Aquimarina callyspongiae TaxID=3098150 RepID=UPI002AB45792|nr:histidine kinase [Aquimarina sp. 2201CG5-10]MDY8134297.1 histidine kinase [Aquimarina sp. 2201CG5-10]
MRTVKISKNSWFWILQFLGWGGLGITQVVLKYLVIEPDNLMYLLLEGALIVITGILFTNALRAVIKRRVSLDNFGFKSFLFVVIVLLTCSISLAFFQELVAQYFYVEITGKDIETNSIANYINTFIIIFLWLILYFSIGSIIKGQQGKVERLKLESTLRESQLNTLKGQVNPHFMFNSLNNIRGLMLEDVHKSREMITKLSELLRYSLNSDKVDEISLQKELETVNNYIELSKIQFEKRLTYQEKIEEGLLNIKVPPMLIQMLIENAIKHGIANQIKGGLVKLTIHKENGALCIKVMNTGKLVDNKVSTKIGLQNISERLRLLYGGSSSFTLEEENEDVIAIIKIPLHE